VTVDPYVKWLGLPATAGVPDHYQLLGLERFAVDRALIQQAADGQTRRAQMHQREHPALCREVLDTINAARICLLNPMRKADYDRALRKVLKLPEPSRPTPAAAPTAADDQAGPGDGFPEDILPETTGDIDAMMDDPWGGLDLLPLDDDLLSDLDPLPPTPAAEKLPAAAPVAKPSEGGAPPTRQPSAKQPAAAAAKTPSAKATNAETSSVKSPAAKSPGAKLPAGKPSAKTPATNGKPAAKPSGKKPAAASPTNGTPAARPSTRAAGKPPAQKKAPPAAGNGKAPSIGASSKRDLPTLGELAGRAASLGEEESQALLDAVLADELVPSDALPPAAVPALVATEPLDSPADAELRAASEDPLRALIPPEAGYELLPLDEPLEETSLADEADSVTGAKGTASAAETAVAPGARAARPARRRWQRLAILSGSITAGLIVFAGAAWYFHLAPQPPTGRLASRGSPPAGRQPIHDDPLAEQAATTPQTKPGSSHPPAEPAEPPRHKPLWEIQRTLEPVDGEAALALAESWWWASTKRLGVSAPWARSRAGAWYERARASGGPEHVNSVWAGRLAAVADDKPCRPPLSDRPWGERLGWPLVLADTLQEPEAAARFRPALGMFGGDAQSLPGKGLLIRGGQSTTALWLRRIVSGHYHLTFWFELSGDENLVLWLGGDGHGTSTATGYCLVAGAQQVVLLRQGLPVAKTVFSELVARDVGHKISVLRDGSRLLIWINGALALDYDDPAPLGSPLHSWLAIGATGGTTGRGVLCHDLRLFTRPAGEAAELAASLTLSPLPTDDPTPNGRRLFDVRGAEFLQGGWFLSQPENVAVCDGDRVVLSGPNGAPAVVRRTPLSGDFALEVTFEYVPPVCPRGTWDAEHTHQENYRRYGAEALNLRLLVLLQPQPPDRQQFEAFQPEFRGGWELSVPAGDGQTRLEWVNGAASQVLAETPYYSPMAGRNYTVRLERLGGRTRVFLNGGLLLEGAVPDQPVDDKLPAFVGFRQVFGGVVVRRATAFALDGGR